LPLKKWGGKVLPKPAISSAHAAIVSVEPTSDQLSRN